MRLHHLLLLALFPAPLAAQSTAVDATLTVDSADLSNVGVELRIHHAPAGFRLAMPRHPEYDERYWRFLRDLRVETDGRVATVVREDSAVWRVDAPAALTATVHYRIEVPSTSGVRGSWAPFVSPTGALVGGPYMFLYPVGSEAASWTVLLRLPPGWAAVTGLDRAGVSSYAAPDFATVMDSPILVGRLWTRSFTAAGVRHEVAYWPRPGAAPFDTARLVEKLRAIVTEAAGVFGGLPYRRYAFLLQDAARAGLEHASSVTIGAPSEALAGDDADVLLDVAHEYFHAWNEVRLRPRGWGGLSVRESPPSRELWWMEGATMYYARVLLRRAALARGSRLETLRAQAEEYLDNPASARISPERASLAADLPPGAYGDLQGDYFLTGELVSTVLDLKIRHATAGRRTLDDVMRAMVRRYPQPRGYTDANLERTASQVCGCDLSAFFSRHVRGAELLDFDAALRPLGLHLLTRLDTAADSAGRPLPDLRVWGYVPRGEHR
ncbi:MAG TPA: hypothetical protein VF771_10280, partial [Longimicrobiaceae bacterium]